MPQPYSNDLRRKFFQVYDGGRDSGGDSEAVSGEFELGQEDFRPADEDGRDRGSAVAAGTTQPGDGGPSGVDAGADSAATRFDPAGVATAAGTGTTAAIEPGLDLGGGAAVGAAA